MVATSAQKLSKGIKLDYKNDCWTIVDYAHHMPGKGGAVVRLKIKSLTTGRVLEETFQAGLKLETTEVSHRRMTYLYKDADDYVFMDNADYEQVTVGAEVVGEAWQYMLENTEAVLLTWKNSVISVELPPKVELKVVETFDAVRGDTSTNITKDATLESGYVAQVPLFINNNDLIVIDTRDGSYESRA